MVIKSLRPVEKIPCDIWLYILNFGIIEDALKVHEMTSEFELACCLFMKHQLSSIRYRMLNGVSTLHERLKDGSLLTDNLRLSIIKSIMLLRYLVTELNILYCTTYRYSSNNEAWLIICPRLVSVLEEFENIRKTATTLELRRVELTSFTIRLILNKYFEFMVQFDSELDNKISEVAKLTPFEIRAIDILSCCPCINSQLSLMKKMDNKQTYSITSFFRIDNLKPIFQVPDVYNTNLTNKNKLSKLLTYLRECVQWENVTFLQTIIYNIINLEMQLNFVPDELTRYQLIGNLMKIYENIQNNPYEPIFRSTFITKLEENIFLNEHYNREISCDQNMTGVSVTITIPDQPVDNLPYIVHSFRGQRKMFVGEKIVDLNDEKLSWCKLKDNLWNEAYEKRAFQLCINYREGLNSTSTEAIIDVFFDSSGESQVNLNFVRGEPFTENNIIDVQ